MELTHTIDGLAYYTKAPEHETGCQEPGLRLSVNQYSIRWTCTGCGAYVAVSRLSEPDMEE